MAEEYKQNQMVSVFSNRTICGEEIEPFCLPTSPDTTSQLIAAATNLIWWGIHESLADGREKDAKLCANILLDIIGNEFSAEMKQEAAGLIDSIFDSYSEEPEDE